MHLVKSDRRVIVIDDDIATIKALSRLGAQRGYTAQSFASCGDFAQWAGGMGARLMEAGLPVCLVIDAKALVSDVSWCMGDHIRLIPKICIGLPTTMAPLAHFAEAVQGEFIRKPFTLAKIGDSVEAAFARHLHLLEVARQTRQLRSLFALLSPRELEVAHLVGAGLPNLDIAQVLGITLKTVKAHRAKVMGKTQSGTIAEFVGKHSQYREILAKGHNVLPLAGSAEINR